MDYFEKAIALLVELTSVKPFKDFQHEYAMPGVAALRYHRNHVNISTFMVNVYHIRPPPQYLE